MPHPLREDYEKWGDFDYKFMVVREPVDRFCSMLRYRQEPTRGNLQDENLDAFARDAIDKAIAKGYKEAFGSDDIWREHIPPQVDYYSPSVEFFKFEDGFEPIKTKLELDIPIQHVNISPGEASASHLSDETISRIKKFYRADYETFGY